MLLRELDCLVAASRLADDFEALFFEYLAQVEANDRLVFRDNDGSGQRVSSFIDSCPCLRPIAVHTTSLPSSSS